MMKVLFSDYDGTLVENMKEKGTNGDAIRKLQSEGHKMVICTGRNYQELMRDLPLFDIPFDYLVLNNGGHIVDSHHKTVYLREIKKEVGVDILDYITQHDNIYVYYFDGNRHLGYKDHKTVDSNLYDQEIEDNFKEEYNKVNSFHIIWYYQPDENIETTQKCVDYILQNHANEVEATYNRHYVDVVPKGCSKASGIRDLINIIGNVDEVYAVGDSYNDLPMILEADFGYTFHDAKDDIKEKTCKQVDYVYEVIEDMLEKNI